MLQNYVAFVKYLILKIFHENMKMVVEVLEHTSGAGYRVVDDIIWWRDGSVLGLGMRRAGVELSEYVSFFAEIVDDL